MESLQSPTTRTLLHIMKNRNHFEFIKTEFDEAKREERECQEIADEAEKLRSEPLSKAFTGELKKVMGSMEHPLLHAKEAKDDSCFAAASQKIVSFSPGADTDDIAIANALQFSQPRDDAGVVISMSATPSLVLQARKRTADDIPIELLPPPQDLRELLRQQREMKEAHDQSTIEYRKLLGGFARWQSERHRIFDAVLDSE